MTDEVQLDEAPAPDAPAPDDAAPTGEDHGEADLDSLLSEYDRQEAEAPASEVPALDESALQRLDTLEGFALHVQERDASQAAEQAFKDVVTEAENMLGEGLERVPQGYVGRWINSEMAVNGPLSAAWDIVFAAGSTPTKDDIAHVQSELKRAVDAMNAEVEVLSKAAHFDSKISADRAAVSAAVRGANSAAPEAEEKSVADLQNMTPVDFEKHTRAVSKKYAGA